MLHITVTSLYEYQTQYRVARYQNAMMMVTITCVNYKQQSVVHHYVVCCSAYLHLLNYSGGLHVHCIYVARSDKKFVSYTENSFSMKSFEFSFHTNVFEN